PALECIDDGGIGTRPAYAQFLKRFYQHGFGEPRWWLCNVLPRFQTAPYEGVVLLEIGERALLFIVGLRCVISLLTVDRHEPGEAHGGAGSPKDVGVLLSRLRFCLDRHDVGCDGIKDCRSHLASQ